jgi:hypothetical protein
MASTTSSTITTTVYSPLFPPDWIVSFFFFSFFVYTPDACRRHSDVVRTGIKASRDKKHCKQALRELS